MRHAGYWALSATDHAPLTARRERTSAHVLPQAAVLGGRASCDRNYHVQLWLDQWLLRLVL